LLPNYREGPAEPSNEYSSRKRKKGTHHGSVLDLVSASLLPRVIEDEVEEDVEAAKVSRDLAVSLDVDEEQLVHVLSVGGFDLTVGRL
jgi:hypothetical protein